MNKKGFTLIELIAVLVVLSILISASVAVFINIRNSVLEKEKSNLITYLETKAIEYANETNVTAVSVEDLIKIGLIKPDDETDIYDPVTRESMNCYIIDLVWEDGEYKATFGSDVGKNGTTCNGYTSRKNLVICQVVGNNCNDIKNEQWFKDDITIGLKFINGKRITKESGYEISWKSNTGITSTEDTIKTNVNLIANINYTAKITKDNEVSEASQIVNIDKEAPIINEIKYNTNWSESKEIEIIASDGLGSGVGGYVIVEESAKCTGYNTNNKLTIKSNGNYKVCVKDIAGNETEKVMEITSIDSDAPSISAIVNKNEIIIGDNKNVIDYFIVKYSKSGGSTSCNYENTKNLTIGKYQLTCTAKGGNGKTASASTELNVLPNIPSAPSIATKLENSNGKTYSGTWTYKGIYIDITSNKNDYVTSYEYKLGTGKWVALSSLIITNNNSGHFVYSKDINNTIYVRACNKSGCSEASNGKKLQIDTKAPTIVAKESSNEIKKGTNNKTSSYFIVTYSTSGGTVTCKPDTTGGLDVGTQTLKCVATGGNGKTAEATTKLTVKVQLSPPTIVTRINNSKGELYYGTDTNKKIYIGITPGAKEDVITKYQYKFSSDDDWSNIPSYSLNSDYSGSFTYDEERWGVIYVRACNDFECSEKSNGEIINIDRTPPDIYCYPRGAYMMHGNYARPLETNNCSAYGTFVSNSTASSNFSEDVFLSGEGRITTSITFYDDSGRSGENADWRGSRGNCLRNYCRAVVTGCSEDSAGNKACLDFTYYVKY